jgi:SAM-dependent methyltransferase
MFSKFSAAASRFRLYCLIRLVQGLSARGDGQPALSGEQLHSLLGAWNQLIRSLGARLTSESIAPALTAYLKEQPAATSIQLARALLLNHMPPESWSLVPTLQQRAAPVMSTWTYQNEVMQWDIAPGDLVLDVGSGGWPFKRADHLADKYPDQTTHRMESMVRDARPFFEVDLERLPFAERAYDFVFCSHVLEHLDNPGQAMRELMRVGKRGYIEVPTRLSDILFNFTRLPNHHRWHALVQGDTLTLIEWNEQERRDLGNEYFDALQSPFENQFQSFFERNRDLFFVSYHWSDVINFVIINKDGEIIDSSKKGAAA